MKVDDIDSLVDWQMSSSLAALRQHRQHLPGQEWNFNHIQYSWRHRAIDKIFSIIVGAIFAILDLRWRRRNDD